MRGRVLEVQRVHVTVELSDGQTVLATVRGEFHETGEYPKVGDWVSVSLVDMSEEAQAVIESIEPRQSVISRLDQETQQPQVLVTNVDLVLIVMGLDGDFNVKRLERYLLLARQSNIRPVVVLNKADVVNEAELEMRQAEVRDAVSDVTVLTVSAKSGAGLEQIRSEISADTTAVLLGSSGAGKSTITNWLLGAEAQETGGVRDGDSRGRHTTTTRQLFALPGGGYLIDTPGMRELGLVESEVATHEVLIAQIEELAQHCRFRNCDHYKSAGCAVLAAVEAGELSITSLENYYKLARERTWQQDKSDGKGRYQEQSKKRSAQARAAAHRKRLSGR